MFPSEPLDEEQQAKTEEEKAQNGNFIKHYEFENVEPASLNLRGVQHIFEIDHDFVSNKKQQKFELMSIFQKAFENYIEGDWVNAYANLTQVQLMNSYDGPTKWMIEYMESLKNIPPENWQGFRDIDFKPEFPELQNPIGFFSE